MEGRVEGKGRKEKSKCDETGKVEMVAVPLLERKQKREANLIGSFSSLAMVSASVAVLSYELATRYALPLTNTDPCPPKENK
ncbi:hypothetical protein VNO78_07822 [Psophocarpus tetragonolobus]|uniref:Uncharacterized protein n=1 Tax=Psophocarpus tetragonolobus TaxID=3891 RepID=A0AAN9SVA4_PSOTE